MGRRLEWLPKIEIGVRRKMFKKWLWLIELIFTMGLLLFGQPLWAAPKVETVGSLPTLSKHTSNVSLATVKIYDDKSLKWATNGQPITIWLPGEVTYVKEPAASTLPYYIAIENEGINLNFMTAGENFLTISVTDGAYRVSDVSVCMEVYFNQEGYSKVNAGEISGDLKVLIEAPNTVFDLKDCIVGKTAGQGLSIESRAKPTISPGTYDAKAGQIKVFENCPGAVKAGNEIILTASRGVSFARVKIIPYLGWGSGDIEPQPIDQTGEGLSRVKLKVKKDTSSSKYGGAMLLDIWYDVPSEFADKEIKVTLVRTTEVVVTGVNEVANAEVADLGVEVSADDSSTATIFAGRTGTGATIFLEESKAGSLIQNRTITLTLPDKFTWNDKPAVVVTEGNVKLDGGKLSSDKQMVTFTVTRASTTASTIEFCEPKFDVEPDAPPGGVTVTIGGSAGTFGEVVNAEVIEPFTFTAEKPEMKIGSQTLEAGAITISETKEKAFMKESPTQDGKIIITTPTGVTISERPEVSVVGGDVKIDKQDIRLEDLGRRSRLTIPVTAESTKASTIEITGLKYSLNRGVPEGDILVTFLGSAMHTVGDEIYKVANAVCITPAPGTSKIASTFTIGKKTYLLGDIEQEMDVAPYIKNSRTYGPIRYIAYALGLGDQDIIWDAASQSVTLLQGKKVAQFYVGKASMVVQGGKISMDVAPEIVSPGRVMLPYRWVALALGGKVEWKPETQEVIIQTGRL